MPKQIINLKLNGRPYELAVEPSWTLLETVREQAGLTGSKEGCGTGDCGACSMILRGPFDSAPARVAPEGRGRVWRQDRPQDERGRLVTSCLMLAVQADGADVLTIEGLARDGELDPLQRAFIETGGVQCGFCTPGMIMAAKALLDCNPRPAIDEIREGLAGNLCRCTGYTKIYEAVMAASRQLLKEPA